MKTGALQQHSRQIGRSFAISLLYTEFTLPVYRNTMVRFVFVAMLLMTTLLQSFVGVTESRAATAETAQIAVEQVIVEAPFAGEATATLENREHCCKDQVADKPQGASCKIDIKFFVATNLLTGQRACETTKIFGDSVAIARLTTPLFRPPIL